jgi:hypothetical protein
MTRANLRNYLLLFSAAILVCLAAGEAAVRLAALFSPRVDYLASAGFRKKPKVYNTLEDFTESSSHLVPHRDWANYRTNSLGFNDLEFLAEKPPGRFRILALGDSFCYGMVPYPANVQTLVEERLKRDHGRDLEVLNLGLPAAHTWEYEVLFRLARPVFRPDLVAIHFYMGNDGPDLVRHLNGLPVRVNSVWSSRLFTFVRNSVRLLRGLETNPPGPDRPGPGRKGTGSREGGRKVDPDRPDPTDQSPSFVRPRFTPAAFARQMSDELVRLYRPGPEAARQDWAPVLANLDRITSEAGKNGIATVLILYPSVLQVDQSLRARTVSQVVARGNPEGFDPARVDPEAPNRALTEFARQRGLPCLDLTPDFRKAVLGSDAPLYLNRDTHWNFAGNALAAKIEARFLGRILRNVEAPAPAAAARDGSHGIR